jgi:hypothetical protein
MGCLPATPDELAKEFLEGFGCLSTGHHIGRGSGQEAGRRLRANRDSDNQNPRSGFVQDHFVAVPKTAQRPKPTPFDQSPLIITAGNQGFHDEICIAGRLVECR